MAERIVETLSPVVGADHVKSSVTIEYNSNSGESTQEQYDPNAPAVLSSQTTQDQTTGLPAAGIPGTPSNVPSAQPPPAPAKTAGVTQGMTSESKTFAVSKTVHHILEPAGQIKHLAVAVLVDDIVEVKEVSGKRQETRKKRSPEEMKQLDELVRAAVGFDAKRGDELAIQNISFQVPPVEVPAAPSPIQLALRTIQPWLGLLRYAGLGILFLLIYLLVLRPMTRQVLATVKALPMPGNQAALPALGGNQAHPNPLLTSADIEKQLAKELSETSSEVMRTVALKRHLVDKVKKEPDGATRLIQNWVRQDAEVHS
jgi:flagellar M-ring protein FliF